MTGSNKGKLAARLAVAGVLALPLALSSCDDPSSSKQAPKISTPTPIANNSAAKQPTAPASSVTPSVAPVEPVKPVQIIGDQWDYRQQKDPMADGAAYFASVESTNTVSFGFPYSGAQHATLILRTHPRYGKDVIFRIERGQILCPSYDGCNVLVRFDDAKATTYHASAPEDNSSETVFISAYSSFMQHLVKSKRVRITANIYQEGTPVFEFDVSGFSTNKYIPTTNKK